MYDFKKFGAYLDTQTAGFNLAAAAVVVPALTFGRHSNLRRIGLKVVGAIISTGAIVVTLRKRPTPYSAAGQSTLGTITIPAAATVGQIYYLEFNPDLYPLKAGEQVAFEVTTAAAGGGAAGNACVALVDIDDGPQDLRDDTAFIKVLV